MRSALKPDVRVRVLGVGVALALGAVLTAGCDTVENSAVGKTVQEVVEKSPKDKLFEAAPSTTTPPYTYTIVQAGSPDDASDVSGVVDAHSKAYELTTQTTDAELGYTLSMSFRVVDQKSWIKIKFTNAGNLGLPEVPEKWMPIDPAKLKSTDVPKNWKEQDEDPARLGPLFDSIVDAKEAPGGKFSGTLDYTLQPDVEILPAATVKALGKTAEALPFTATITDGKVTGFVLSVPAAGTTKAQTYTVAYDKYGATPAVAAPTAAETAEATAFVYEMLNG